MKRIVIGTRASKLAMIQTNWIVEQLHQQWPFLEITIEQIRTTGDQIRDVPLTRIGGDGVFVMEIERALVESRIDLAVHSLKDLPTAQPEGLRIVVVGPREDVRDVLVWNSELLQHRDSDDDQDKRMLARQGQAPPLPYMERERLAEYGRGGAYPCPGMWSPTMSRLRQPYPLRIGTCSLRRTAQIRSLYPDAQILPLRGNVDTRLRKLDAGDYDAIVLAAAGLHRLGMHERLADRIWYLPIETMMPAPGQGALGLEIRDEPEMQKLLVPIYNRSVQATTSAERMFMRRLGAGCYLPVAAHAEIVDEALTLLGLVTSLDGQCQVRVRQSISWISESSIEHAERLGVQLAEQALAQGAGEIIHAIDVIRGQERQHA